ncbi:biotin/lipoyl-binding protein [candidate division KSB1 bacterium]|nr:biotin/lipoyl-binding protein [candidate division KSB1 bacterium]
MRNYKFNINGKPFGVNIKNLTDYQAIVEVNGAEYTVDIIHDAETPRAPELVHSPKTREVQNEPSKTKAPERTLAAGTLKAPLPGLILEVLVKKGDEVKHGQTVLRMEAMKMENNILANRDGVIQEVKVKSGDSVLEGDVMVEIGG